jgi:uncharacterized membrane protein YdjX (TVP38/TMEM64 family)
MKRFGILFGLLTFVVLLIFGIWGDRFESLFNPEDTRLLLENTWSAGPIGAALLVSDILLPIPTTVVIGAMGAVLGPVTGAFWGWVGLTLAGWTGYVIARLGGAPIKRRWISAEEEEKFGRFFDHKGGLAVVLSRMLPVLPEVLSLLAGFYGMHPLRFGIAVTLGSIPPAVLFSWIGSTARDAPLPAFILLTAITGLLWMVFLRMSKDGPAKD